MIETLIYTLPSLLNVTSLLVMVLFIYTILGMSFFGNMPLCEGEGTEVTENGVLSCPYGLYNHHANFKHFWTGFFTLFRMSTGESWNGIMHDAMAYYGSEASFYFVSYMVVGSSLMFNLVIAILLDEFSSMGASDSYEVTPEAIAEFSEKWQQLDPSGSYEIPCKKLVQLLTMVKPPLGVGPDGSPAEAHLMLLKVNAPINKGSAHFVETFVSLVRFAYKVDHLDEVLYNKVVAQLVAMFPSLGVGSSESVSKGQEDEAHEGGNEESAAANGVGSGTGLRRVSDPWLLQDVCDEQDPVADLQIDKQALRIVGDDNKPPFIATKEYF